MSNPTRTRRTARYTVPLAVGLTVFGLAVLPRAASGANPHPALPQRGPAQLLVDVSRADVAHFSGTVVLTARLGLPDLAAFGGVAGSADLTSLLGGSHTAQVSYGGPDRQRVALLDTLVETEIVRNGRDLWVYESRSNTATRHRLRYEDGEPTPFPTPSVNPAELANELLKEVGPTTSVTVDRTARIAGRAAYQLVLAPKQRGSLIRSVRIGIDAATHLPLRVQVYGTSGSPAVELGFVDVSFANPPASTFAFTPPAGSVVEDGGSRPLPDRIAVVRKPGADLPQFLGSYTRYSAPPKVVGEGWTAVAELPARSLPLNVVALLRQVGDQAGGGAVVVRTKLLTVLLEPDGRVLVGAVTPDVLDRVAGR
jgi:outer membrane lipoprotein-sorting protein